MKFNAFPRQDDPGLRAAIHAQLEPFAAHSNHYDFRGLSYSQVTKLVHDLVISSNIVLHGCDSNTPYAELDPAFSKPITKVPSVFATTDVRVALMNATFRAHGSLVDNIRHGIDESNGFAAAMYVDGQTKIFEAPPGIANALRQALASHERSEQFNELFADGMIYIVAGRFFARDDPRIGVDGLRLGGSGFTDHEVNSPTKVVPLATLRVSRRLVRDLFCMHGSENDTIHIYSEEEMELRRKWRRKARVARSRVLGR